MTKRKSPDKNLQGPKHEAEAKLKEVEAAIQARRESQELDENIIGSIVDYIEEKIEPFTLNNTGIKGVEKLYKKFDHSGIIDAIDISADRYLEYNSDNELERSSVEIFVKKIGGILTLKNRPPIDQKIAYVKGICRNRFHYWNDRQGTQILQAYVAALRNCKYSEDELLIDFEEQVIPRTKTCDNWSQWRNLIEGWTEQIEGWANDLEIGQHEQQPYEQYDENSDAPAAVPEDNLYIEEKRKGGANSYQAYKPLRDKVQELCVSKLHRANYSSANQLCSAVAAIIEREHPDLLSTFQPYQNYEREGNDWKRPTFYGWCNSHYKAHKS